MPRVSLSWFMLVRDDNNRTIAILFFFLSIPLKVRKLFFCSIFFFLILSVFGWILVLYLMWILLYLYM